MYLETVCNILKKRESINNFRNESQVIFNGESNKRFLEEKDIMNEDTLNANQYMFNQEKENIDSFLNRILTGYNN